MTRVKGHRRVSMTGRVHGVKAHRRAGGPSWWSGQSMTAARASAGFATASAATWTLTAFMSVIAAIMCGIATACLALLGFDTGVRRRKARQASGYRPRKTVTRLRAELGFHRARAKAKTWKARWSPKKRYRAWKRSVRDRLAGPWRRTRARVVGRLFPAYRATFTRKDGAVKVTHRKNGKVQQGHKIPVTPRKG